MKNIVICCDGTGNEISENISNVLKLYRMLRKTGKTTPNQVVFYDPGVGTLARPDPFLKLKQDWYLVIGLALGYGLDDNVLRAYEFLIDNYEEGDAVYLFGFSRGAYAVRVLAALIHKIGLLSRQQTNLAGSGLTAYKATSASADAEHAIEAGEGDDEAHAQPATQADKASQFARITSSPPLTIRFVGVWDTVASVIVPRPDRFYLPSLQTLLHTQANPGVKIFRQAIALDERRRMFRLHRWDEPQPFRPNRFRSDSEEAQDIKQVWFAGVHADIGGGYPEAESGISKHPLIWMVEEAVAAGLAVNPATVRHLAWGRPRKGSPYSYVAPSVDAEGEPHDSMNLAWRILEFLPKRDIYKEWPQRYSDFGLYIPNAEPRPVPDGACIHESVVARMKANGNYRPVNLKEDLAGYTIVPMAEEP